MAIYTRALGYTAEETQAVIARVQKDIQKTEAHLYLCYFFLWGQKPY